MASDCTENPQSSRPANTATPGDKLLGVALLTSVTGASMLFGFGLTLAMAKRKDPTFFAKGVMPSKDSPETGGSLALRALGWGTLYAVSGFSVFCWAIWKAIGVQNLEEFRFKMGNLLPKIPKHEPQGKSDFKTVRELISYIINEDQQRKK